MSVTDEAIKTALTWFGKYAQTEKSDVEQLFSKLTLQERRDFSENYNDIFTLREDVEDMQEIFDVFNFNVNVSSSNILRNAIRIVLRSMVNHNFEELVDKIRSDNVKYAFLIIKRHLILYARVEASKDKPFYEGSDYKSIYGFCKVFSVPNKLSVLLMNNLNIKNIEEWLNFDTETNQHCIESLKKYGIKKFEDICLILHQDKSQIIKKISKDMDDKRLEFKLLHLTQTIRLFERKWRGFIHF